MTRREIVDYDYYVLKVFYLLLGRLRAVALLINERCTSHKIIHLPAYIALVEPAPIPPLPPGPTFGKIKL
jgi:hypothetical protein